MSQAAEAFDERDAVIAGARARDTIAAARRFAQDNPAVFAQLVYRDEAGRSVELAPMHEAWHSLMSRHDRVVLWSHTGGGKSTQVALLRVLWEVGRNPMLRVLILSNTHGQAAKLGRLIAEYVESSAPLHDVFPDCLPTKRKSEPWQPLSGQVTVRRPHALKDATVTCAGIHGNILGARYDLVVMDDVLDEENTRTPAQRRDTIDWLSSVVFGRLTPGARVWVIGTAFHPDDALHHFGALFSKNAGAVRAWRYPVLDDAGDPRWPQLWPRSRIDKRRLEIGSARFARQMMCVARDDAAARFKWEWIEKAVRRGADRRMRTSLENVPPGCSVYTGVDLAVKQHSAADLTVFTTILVHPNGEREVLCIESGRWAGPEIVHRVIDTHRRFASVVVVEDNAAQEFIVQFTKNVSAVPVRPFTTTASNKRNPEFGVESLAAEFEAGKWILPSEGGMGPEVQGLVDEMLYYQPTSHTGDRLMSLWFAREAAREVRPKAQTGFLGIMSR